MTAATGSDQMTIAAIDQTAVTNQTGIAQEQQIMASFEKRRRKIGPESCKNWSVYGRFPDPPARKQGETIASPGSEVALCKIVRVSGYLYVEIKKLIPHMFY